MNQPNPDAIELARLFNRGDVDAGSLGSTQVRFKTPEDCARAMELLGRLGRRFERLSAIRVVITNRSGR